MVKDETRAFELYQRACEGKEAAGCANLGNLYSDGRGTRRDLAQAVTSYKVACDADLARGCSGLGYAYGVGEGVTKDLVRAAQLYQKACNGEYWLACNNLAVVYRDGLGVARDEVRSVPLFKKACDNGEPHACYNLGIAYEFAHGVSMDEDIAKQFYEKACHASNATACSNLQRLNQESGNSVQAVEEKPRGIANEARQDASQKVSRPPRSLQGKNYAVLFAGSEYEHWPSLVNPVVDAKAVAEELQQSYGFETRLVPNPTSEQIFSVLMEYAKKNPPLGPSDQLFVFVAGHGDFIESTKEGFLVGRNSLRAKDDPGHATYVPHSRLQVILSNLSAGHVLLVMDSCFSGTFDRRITHRGSRGEEEPYATASLPEFVDRMMKYPTRLYLTSGGKEYVPDGRPNEHSPFARQLLLALRNNGGPRGYLTMSRLIEYFERVQPEPMYGEFQGNEPGGDFIFVPTR